MLVYLDTAQFVWLEQAEQRERERFLESWGELGCELAVSLQILQEVRKRGTAKDVSSRLTTISTLQPLRGIPAGSAGVASREAAVQIRELLGVGPDDPLAYGRGSLFPPMELGRLGEAMTTHSADLQRFNLVGHAAAQIQANIFTLPGLKKGVQVDPHAMEKSIRAMQEVTLRDLPDGVAKDMAQSVGERTIEAIKAADGDLCEVTPGT